MEPPLREYVDLILGAVDEAHGIPPAQGDEIGKREDLRRAIAEIVGDAQLRAYDKGERDQRKSYRSGRRGDDSIPGARIGPKCRAAVGSLKDVDELLSMRSARHQYRGIYFLFKNDELVYIGRSLNVPRRLHSHEQDDWDSYAVIESDLREFELDLLERAYISKYRPKYNKANVT